MSYSILAIILVFCVVCSNAELDESYTENTIKDIERISKLQWSSTFETISKQTVRLTVPIINNGTYGIFIKKRTQDVYQNYKSKTMVENKIFIVDVPADSIVLVIGELSESDDLVCTSIIDVNQNRNRLFIIGAASIAVCLVSILVLLWFGLSRKEMTELPSHSASTA